MLSRIILVLSTIFLTWTLGSVPAAAQRSKLALPTRSVLAKYGMEREWWNQAVIHKSGDEISFLTADDQFLFTQSKAGNITAFDLRTGKRAWYYRYGAARDFTTRITSTEDAIYFVSGSHLVSLDRFRGTQNWSLRLPGPVTSQLHIDDEQIYFGDISGMFYALDLGRAYDYADKGLLPSSSYDTINWRFRSGDQVVFTPEGVRRNVVFISRDGTLYSIDKDSRVDQLQFEGDSPLVAPMAVRGEFLYLSVADPSLRLDQRVFCMHERTGRIEWQKVMTQPVLKPLILVDQNKLFITPLRAGTSLLEADYGTEIWNNPNAEEFLTLTKSYVLGSDQYQNILVIDRENGTTLSRIPLRDFSFRLQNDQNDRLYIATPDGIVVSIHEEGAKFPTFYKGMENNPIAPTLAPDDEEAAENGEEPSESTPEENNEAEPAEEEAKPEPPPAPNSKKPEKEENLDDFFN